VTSRTEPDYDPPADLASSEADRPGNFLEQIIDRDLAEGRYREVVTRFPPEPNGYLHIGHAKSIYLNFTLAQRYGGRCHLRFDDTNPTKEEQEYVDAIQRDVRWLGFDWGGHLYFASDYFERMYALAEQLVRDGHAYVDSQPRDAIREQRGTLTEPGQASPWRDRPPAESLALLRRMRAGELPEGSHVLRARGDMASPNMLMRDPLLYRILHATHHRTGDAWHIYPMYDYAHCLEDAIEGVSHSICTLEFENNRELYDWVLDRTGFAEPRPHQFEFARLNLDYTVMSKRKLLRLVQEGHVEGWDDPRMPTLAGLRRRGVTARAIHAFCDMIGVARTNSVVDIGKLEYCVRDDLNHEAPRVMAVLDPLRVVLTTWPEGEVDHLDASLWPHDVPKEGSRPVPVTRTLFIERDDFMEDPPKGYYRLSPGAEVRLRYAYVIRCDEVVRDGEGAVVELRCSHDASTRGGTNPADRKVRGTIHWVSAEHALAAEVRLYDRLFAVPNPECGGDLVDHLNPSSKVVVTAMVEPSLAAAPPGAHFQFERQGYFFTDPHDHGPGRLVFNRVVALKDSWARRTEGAPAEPSRHDPPAAGGDRAGDEERARPERRTRVQIRARAREEDPELATRFARYIDELGLAEDDADVLSGERELADFFEAAIGAHDDVAAVTRWLVNVLLAELKELTPSELPFDGAAFGRLVALADGGVVSTPGAKTALDVMLAEGGDPATIIEAHGLRQVRDEDALGEVIARVLAGHPDNVQRYRDGKTQLLGFFVGQVMRETGGSADPTLVKSLLAKALS